MTTMRRLLVLAGLAALLLLGATMAWPAAPARDALPALAGPRGVAAVVDGDAVPMALYRRELGIYWVTLPGPVPAAGSPAWAARDLAAQDRALRQAVAVTIIDREAARRDLTASRAAIEKQLGAMRAQAGGAVALAAIARAEGLRPSDLWAMARTAVLDDLLLRRAGDPHLVDRIYAHAHVIYYVGPLAGRRGLAPAPTPGHPAPELAATTLGGVAVSLAGLRGTPVILSMWSTTCTWCRFEMPLLDRFARARADVRVVALDVGEDPATVRAYARALGLRLTIWLDPGAAAASAYDLSGLPDTFAIDRSGEVRAVTIGALGSAGVLRRDATAATRG